jgi:hypothetical protein
MNVKTGERAFRNEKAKKTTTASVLAVALVFIVV